MLHLYKTLTLLSRPFLSAVLRKRLRMGKEDPLRLNERMGIAKISRPDGILFWVHAASVGEAQSALILIQRLLEHPSRPNILITTGTVTSAQFLAGKLPERTIHQFYPLDHPAWVNRFLAHWQPDYCFWMESELWPNMLASLQKRKIPAALVNAHMSARSFKRWSAFRGLAQELLRSFTIILAQTEQEADYYRQLGAKQVIVTNNLKYSAAPLTFDQTAKAAFQSAIQSRPVWLYASTHKGEEELACAVHKELKIRFKDLLTIIVPRHPERGSAIAGIIADNGLSVAQRSLGNMTPDATTDIYLADTIGELGLFYSLAPIAMIGRSFSEDGGGGHNPLEAAQLGCAVLHGPHVQNLADIFMEMDQISAAQEIATPDKMAASLEHLLSHPEDLISWQQRAIAFAGSKGRVIDEVMQALEPSLKTVTQ